MTRDEIILRAAEVLARAMDPSVTMSAEEVVAAVLSRRWERRFIAGYVREPVEFVDNIYYRRIAEWAPVWKLIDEMGVPAFVEQHLTGGFAKAIDRYEAGVRAAGLRKELEAERKVQEAADKRLLNKTPKLTGRQAFSAIAASHQKLASDELLADFFSTTATEIRLMRNPQSVKYREEWGRINITFSNFNEFAAAYFPPIAREALRDFVAGRAAMAATEAAAKLEPKERGTVVPLFKPEGEPK